MKSNIRVCIPPGAALGHSAERQTMTDHCVKHITSDSKINISFILLALTHHTFFCNDSKCLILTFLELKKISSK